MWRYGNPDKTTVCNEISAIPLHGKSGESRRMLRLIASGLEIAPFEENPVETPKTYTLQELTDLLVARNVIPAPKQPKEEDQMRG